MKHSACFAALFTCRCAARAPPTFPLLSSPTNRANLFLLSPNTAVVALHAIPPHRQHPLWVAGAEAYVTSVCEDADLALLQLDKPLLHNFSASFTSPRKNSVCFALSPALSRLRLKFLRVESAIIVYSASRLPVFAFSASTSVLHGWSGSPVVTAQNELVGVLIQARQNVVHVVPSRFVQLLQHSRHTLALGYVPASHVQSGPSQSRKVLVQRNVDEMRKGDIVVQIGSQHVHGGFVRWQGLWAPPQAAVVQLFGTQVRLRVLRQQEPKTVCVSVRRATEACAAIGRHDGICVLAGPYKFSALSIEMLESFGPRWQIKAPRPLVMAAMNDGDGYRVVVVSRAPDSRCNLLFQKVQFLNDEVVKSVEQLALGGVISFESGETLTLPSATVRRCANPL